MALSGVRFYVVMFGDGYELERILELDERMKMLGAPEIQLR